jgi:hypothetical protein
LFSATAVTAALPSFAPAADAGDWGTALVSASDAPAAVLLAASAIYGGVSGSELLAESSAPDDTSLAMGPSLKLAKAISSGGRLMRILPVELSRTLRASAALRDSVARRPPVSRPEDTITLTFLPFSRLVMSTTEFRGKALVAML